jgi:hypothetical protein
MASIRGGSDWMIASRIPSNQAKHEAHLQHSGRQCPSAEQVATPRCSAESDNGVRVDERVIDRGIPSHQIGSHQEVDSVTGRGLLRGSLLCIVEPWRLNKGVPMLSNRDLALAMGLASPASNGPCGRRRRSLRRRLGAQARRRSAPRRMDRTDVRPVALPLRCPTAAGAHQDRWLLGRHGGLHRRR